MSDERIIKIENLETTSFVSNIAGITETYLRAANDVTRDDSTEVMLDSINSMTNTGINVDVAMQGMEKFMKAFVESFKELDEQLGNMKISTERKEGPKGTNPYKGIV